MEQVDPKSLKDDRYGYSVYTCVAMAPEPTQRILKGVRDRLRVNWSMIPAHVTVRGGFGRITRIEGVVQAIQDVCTQHEPLELQVGAVFHSGNSSMFHCEMTPQFRKLHEDLVYALQPISVSAYPVLDRFRAHMTVYSYPSGEIEDARRYVETVKVGPAIPVKELTVWGHRGEAYTGRWDLLHTFPLKRARS